jgi:hypothetical protein
MKTATIAFALAMSAPALAADAVEEHVYTAHRFGNEMAAFIDGCLIEMKVYHDTKHDDCRAFDAAAAKYMAAREKIAEYLVEAGALTADASSGKEIVEMSTVVLIDGEPAYGILAGWDAMDRFLDRVQVIYPERFAP